MNSMLSNLVSVTSDGDVLWQAEYPTNNSSDRYDHISSVDPLAAYSNQSFDCILDPATGAERLWPTAEQEALIRRNLWQ